VRTPTHRLIIARKGMRPDELYDLRHSLVESENIAAKDPKTVKAIHRLLDKRMDNK
jgi:hypothetical protein